MPVERILVRRRTEPVPVHVLPETRDVIAKASLFFIFPVEVLPRGEQALHQEGSLDEVGAILIDAEDRKYVAGAAAEEVRPHAMVAVRARKERSDLQQPVDNLLAGGEATLRANCHGHNAEAAGAKRDDIIISGRILTCHA